MLKTDIKNDFLIYVIEEYKFHQNLCGKEVVEIFSQYNVFDYILRHYEALHTTGGKYIVEDINLYIETQKNRSENEGSFM